MEPEAKTDEQLKQKLSPEEYRVLREQGTEAPYSGEYLEHDAKGMYHCKVCGNALFASEQKLDSSAFAPGLREWPSFSDPAVAENVGIRPDDRYGMDRSEVYCKHCGSHLGHVFNDPSETSGKHYCINSICLAFEEGGEGAAKA